MVRRVHKYADGGKIVKDHTDDPTATNYKFKKPSYMDAVKDRVKGFFTGGAAGQASDKVSGRQRQIDKVVDDAS